ILGDNVEIGLSAFCDCKSLTKVSFAGTVPTIGSFAFEYCALLDMEMPDGLKEIGTYAFSGCTSLKQANLPETVTTLGSSAFKNCTSLKSAAIPEKNSRIRDNTFSGCTSLESVTLNSRISEIEKNAFSDCSSLKTVNYPGTQSQWNSIKIGDGNQPLLAATLNLEDGTEGNSTAHRSTASSDTGSTNTNSAERGKSVISYNLEHKEIPLYESDFQNKEYTITLEDSPYFPYEIQFTLNGQAQTKWFMNANDSVTVDGYTFRVDFSGAARSLSFRVGNNVVQAYVSHLVKEGDDYVSTIHKVFDNTGSSSLLSSLSYTSLIVDLHDRFWSELEDVTLANFPENQPVWVSRGLYGGTSDQYTKIDKDYRFDKPEDGYSGYNYHIIVGATSQSTIKDSNNAQYNVSTKFTPVSALNPVDDQYLHFHLFGAEGGQQEAEIINSVIGGLATDSKKTFYGLALSSAVLNASDAYLSMEFGSEYFQNRNGIDVTVYEGEYETESEAVSAGAKDVTAQIWRRSGQTSVSGYHGDFTKEWDECRQFTLFFKQDGKALEMMRIGVWIQSDKIDIYESDYYLYSGTDSWREEAAGQLMKDGMVHGYTEKSPNDVYATFVLYDEDASTNGLFYVNLNARRTGTSEKDEYPGTGYTFGIQHIRKAAAGRITSKEAFEAATDISEQLFSDSSKPDSEYNESEYESSYYMPSGGYLAKFTDGERSIIFPVGSRSALTTEGSVTMDTAAIVMEGRTYAPARPLAVYFGYEVTWDGATRTVILTKEGDGPIGGDGL
ncbi:MAG: leucine-rich repeat protein, partial [Oscillibacter sp.]|nr:leucine-rich repeat protein [Oscillibacter sp.]